jgi:hypothetical protein
MSSHASRTLPLELEADAIVIAAIAVLAATAVIAIMFAPFAIALRATLGFLAVVVASGAAAEQRFGSNARALRRLSLAGVCQWRLEYGDGPPREACHLDSSICIGRWWFLRWPGGAWAVLSPRVIGERDWRRLSARLRDHARAVASTRNASR